MLSSVISYTWTQNNNYRWIQHSAISYLHGSRLRSHRLLFLQTFTFDKDHRQVSRTWPSTTYSSEFNRKKRVFQWFLLFDWRTYRLDEKSAKDLVESNALFFHARFLWLKVGPMLVELTFAMRKNCLHSRFETLESSKRRLYIYSVNSEWTELHQLIVRTVSPFR